MNAVGFTNCTLGFRKNYENVSDKWVHLNSELLASLNTVETVLKFTCNYTGKVEKGVTFLAHPV